MFIKKILITRKYKLFFNYCVIGIFSILIELLFRKFFILLKLDEILIFTIPLSIGIIFAFICNLKFNFDLPRYYYKKSFFYFVIISISSFYIQYLLSKFISLEKINYETTRFLMSGLVFVVAYNFHIKYSFKKNKKVGIAIYLNKSENIEEIFSKVGFYPDFIHIDMVDKTFNSKVDNPDLTKIYKIKKKWPNHRIESHIMSTNPLKYLDKFCKYSDTIYFHSEIKEDQRLIKKKISNKGKEPGIVIHALKKNDDIKNIIKDFKEILILSIKNPGSSGQRFNHKAFKILNTLNYLNNRSNFSLCVDGGITDKNIRKIECEKVVSASNVFRNINPKKQIDFLKDNFNN